jgi:hypothetical protein
MPLTFEQIDDFVELTLPNIKRDLWADISEDLQEFTYASRWFKKGEKPERGGPYLKFELQVDNQDNAADTGLYAVDDIDRKNVMTHGKQVWSMQTCGYTYDVREDEFQSGPERIIRFLDVHERNLSKDFLRHMERKTWTAPASSSSNPMPPAGIPFWFQKSATEGFNGGDPAGWGSGAAEIATGTYSAWKNWTFGYAQVSRDDMVEKVLNAMDHCYFKPPVEYKELGGGEPNWELYTVHSVLATCRKLLEAQNDNLGRSVGWGANGAVLVRSTELKWVPALDTTGWVSCDTSTNGNPIYGVNWRTLEYFFREGQNMVKHPPSVAPNQHNVRQRFMDNTGNFVCYNRRANFVGYDTTL